MIMCQEKINKRSHLSPNKTDRLSQRGYCCRCTGGGGGVKGDCLAASCLLAVFGIFCLTIIKPLTCSCARYVFCTGIVLFFVCGRLRAAHHNPFCYRVVFPTAYFLTVMYLYYWEESCCLRRGSEMFLYLQLHLTTPAKR